MDVLYWLVFFLKYEFRFANTDVRVWKSNYYRPPDYNTQKALLEQYLSTSSNVERADTFQDRCPGIGCMWGDKGTEWRGREKAGGGTDQAIFLAKRA